jgi:hypothetical protein
MIKQTLIRRFKSSRMLHCCLVNKGTAWPWRWRHHDLVKHQELFTEWQTVPHQQTLLEQHHYENLKFRTLPFLSHIEVNMRHHSSTKLSKYGDQLQLLGWKRGSSLSPCDRTWGSKSPEHCVSLSTGWQRSHNKLFCLIILHVKSFYQPINWYLKCYGNIDLSVAALLLKLYQNKIMD